MVWSIIDRRRVGNGPVSLVQLEKHLRRSGVVEIRSGLLQSHASSQQGALKGLEQSVEDATFVSLKLVSATERLGEKEGRKFS